MNLVKPGIARTMAVLIALGSSGLINSCGSVREREPDLRGLYRQSAKRTIRNPVIVIHGILGSRLVERDTGDVVWGAFTKEAVDINTPQGVRSFAVPLGDPTYQLSKGSDTSPVYATGPVDKIEVDLFFGIVSVDVYAAILRSLGVGGYSDQVFTGPEYSEEHFTCHSFFYDWRLDNVHNAQRLGRHLAMVREQVRQSAQRKAGTLRSLGSAESLEEAQALEDWLAKGFRFDIVAHSMGGLIARYYLRYGEAGLHPQGQAPDVTWAGADQIDRLILVGTPNLGSIAAVENLHEGIDMGLFLPEYPAAVIGTLPSVYQLMPRNQNRLLRDPSGAAIDIDLFDLTVWEDNQWGLFGPDQDKRITWLRPDLANRESRLNVIREHVGWCLERAQRFHEALDFAPSKTCPAEIKLFAADTLPTQTLARVGTNEHGHHELSFHDEELMDYGDQTVPRYSAVGNLGYGHDLSNAWLQSTVPWTNVTFLPDDHVGLTSNPVFTDNLLFYLLEQAPPPRPGAR